MASIQHFRNGSFHNNSQESLVGHGAAPGQQREDDEWSLGDCSERGNDSPRLDGRHSPEPNSPVERTFSPVSQFSEPYVPSGRANVPPGAVSPEQLSRAVSPDEHALPSPHPRAPTPLRFDAFSGPRRRGYTPAPESPEMRPSASPLSVLPPMPLLQSPTPPSGDESSQDWRNPPQFLPRANDSFGDRRGHRPASLATIDSDFMAPYVRGNNLLPPRHGEFEEIPLHEMAPNNYQEGHPTHYSPSPAHAPVVVTPAARHSVERQLGVASPSMSGVSVGLDRANRRRKITIYTVVAIVVLAMVAGGVTGVGLYLRDKAKTDKAAGPSASATSSGATSTSSVATTSGSTANSATPTTSVSVSRTTDATITPTSITANPTSVSASRTTDVTANPTASGPVATYSANAPLLLSTESTTGINGFSCDSSIELAFTDSGSWTLTGPNANGGYSYAGTDGLSGTFGAPVNGVMTTNLGSQKGSAVMGSATAACTYTATGNMALSLASNAASNVATFFGKLSYAVSGSDANCPPIMQEGDVNCVYSFQGTRQ